MMLARKLAMDAKERRRHVRMKQIPECTIVVAMVTGSPVTTSIPVIDVGLGGLGLELEGPLADMEVGTTFAIRVSIGRYGDHEFLGRVRWKNAEMVGLEFVEPAEEKTRAVGRYVAELLERGAPS